jgi:hypothetical protein
MAADFPVAENSSGRGVVLTAPAFSFTLETADGLRAVAWENRLTGRTLQLSGGPEVEFDIGLPGQPLITPKLRVTRLPSTGQASAGEAVFELAADQPALSVKVTYRWDAREPVLRKFVTITNRGREPWDRLLNVRLGQYATGTAKLTGGELQVYPPSFRQRAHRIGGLQGFPVYAEDEFFFSLAHPAGWATQEPGKVSLRHYPGAVLKPGESRDCMEAVYGVGSAGLGRNAFVAHIRSRMRRVVRGHDRPYAIFEPFGGRTGGAVNERNRSADAMYAAGNLFDENEPYLLDMIAKVAEGQQGGAGRFDFLSIDFWVDNKGDIKRADPWRFPHQFERIKTALDEPRIAPGLWIDSSFCGWSIGGNPAARAAISRDVSPDFCNRDAWKQWETQAYFCRATEPLRSMYTEGFLHHIRNNGVRLLKFDNFNSQCSNPAHDHLPGVYGNEATHEAVIASYRAFDVACPDVFIMLYWGHRSPWWLLYGDTMFETGVEMEAASPGHMPAPYVRDGVTRKLDQGHQFAKDVPWLGTDSLGVWLSHWGGWNSGIGTERWQGAVVMDICRGHALAQIWTDPDWLTPPERRQFHEFIALMKAQPACFTNARLILGDPWKHEPYGYSCSDGQRAFLAINNGTWEDRTVTLDLGPAWGLPADRRWDLCRWYPQPARLAGPADGFGAGARLAMRPFEVVLLEVVPHGKAPSLARAFREEPIPSGFAEASRPVSVQVKVGKRGDAPSAALAWRGQEQGTFSLPSECVVFGPVAKSAGLPSPETMRTVPSALHLGGQRLKGGKAFFSAGRILDLTAFAGPAPSPTTPVSDASLCSWVFIPFTCEKAGPATFGLGANWWYEAWLDGALISETVTKGGNRKVPICVDNHAVTVEVSAGAHVLAIRHFRGADGAKLAVAGPGDFRKAWLAEEVQVIQGTIPASAAGGILAVVQELVDESGKPVEMFNFGSFFAAEATVAGAPAPTQPAIGPESYPSSWQTWRIAVSPGSPAQPFAVSVSPLPGKSTWMNESRFINERRRRFSTYFVPGSMTP